MLGLGLDLSPARPLSAPSWHRAPAYALDAHAPALAADFARRRYAMSGGRRTFDALFALQSGAKRVVNASGLLTEIAANAPAFDFASGRRRLLLEGAATNICLDNNNIVDWERYRATVENTDVYVDTQNSIIEYSISDSEYPSQHYIYGQPQSFVAWSKYTISALFREGSGHYVQIYGSSSVFPSETYATFNVGNGTISEVGANCAAYITKIGDRYLCEVVGTTYSSESTPPVSIYLTGGNPGKRPSYAGNGSFVYCAVPQVEIGERASSRVVTAGAQGSRITDVVQLTTEAKATLQGAACTLAWRGRVKTALASQSIVGLPSSSALLRGGATAGQLHLDGYSGGSLNLGAALPGEIGAAIGWDAAGRAGSVNGAVVVSDANALDRALTDIFLGASSGMPAGCAFELDELVVWPVRGSDAALQAQARGWQ